MTPEEMEGHYLTGDFRLKAEFARRQADNEDLLERSEKYAGWTLPMIFPDLELDRSEEMQHDYQSVGAQAVTNLANKIMMALFQPSRPFFRMDLSEEQREEISGEGMKDAQIDEAMAATERNAMKLLVQIGARPVMTDVIQHLIITGNSLLYMPNDSMVRNYSLRDYVCVRNMRGEVIKLIIREKKTVESLEDRVAAMAAAEGYGPEAEVTLYTGIKWAAGKFLVWQEMEDICYCHKQVGIENADTLPWIPLAWNLAANRDYGTGLVENYAGDFHSLSSFAEAILDYGTIVTDVKNLVDPAGSTDVGELTQAPSGAYVLGREEDLYSYSPDVAQASDFLTAQFSAVEARIGRAFLMNTAVTRDAERVTAEEIRMQALELEGSLGGVYSRLATELQQPLAKRLLKRLDPVFEGITPVIVTGLETLSRSSDLDRMRAFFNDLISLAEVPEEVSDRIDYGQLISMLGSGHGIEYDKFLLDEKASKEKREQRIREQALAAGSEAAAVTQGQNQGT